MQKYQTMKKKVTTSDYNKFTNDVLDVKTREKKLVNESNISRLIDKSDLDKKIATLATKSELKKEQDNIVKLQAFDSSYF